MYIIVFLVSELQSYSSTKKIANIYNDEIELKAKIPAITKTLMSQTKYYRLDIKKTI